MTFTSCHTDRHGRCPGWIPDHHNADEVQTVLTCSCGCHTRATARLEPQRITHPTELPMPF